MKRKKVALYDPYLDVLGGGEQYALTFLDTLRGEGYDVTIFWKEDLSRKIKERFSIDLSSAEWDSMMFAPSKSPLKRFLDLKQYDVLLYITDGSYFLSGAKQNLLYTMIPKKELYSKSFLNIIKLHKWKIIANSQFTAQWLKRWGMKPTVHYPMLAKEYLPSSRSEGKKSSKKNNILSVGRFFGQLHAKKHDVIIRAFEQLQKEKVFKDHTLTLVGGLKEEDKEYYIKLQELTKGNKNIILKPNATHEELLKLYRDSRYFWHFTGFGTDELIHPEQVEHLGITPIEAMALGTIVFCFNAGGPKEIVKNGHNGFLFSSIEELINEMKQIEGNDALQKAIIKNARSFVTEVFSPQTFKKNLLTLLS